jgi:hypothetical protein
MHAAADGIYLFDGATDRLLSYDIDGVTPTAIGWRTYVTTASARISRAHRWSITRRRKKWRSGSRISIRSARRGMDSRSESDAPEHHARVDDDRSRGGRVYPVGRQRNDRREPRAVVLVVAVDRDALRGTRRLLRRTARIWTASLYRPDVHLAAARGAVGRHLHGRAAE